jgi:hypothetical protein
MFIYRLCLKLQQDACQPSNLPDFHTHTARANSKSRSSWTLPGIELLSDCDNQLHELTTVNLELFGCRGGRKIVID